MAELKILNISKTYQASEGKVLNDISLTVNDGEMAFLLGPSGCGKSTLLRILAGLIPADSGKILLDGKDISQLPPEKRNMPMVFQNYALWPHMDVYDNIAFGLKMTNMSKNEINSRVKEMLELVRMEDFIHRKVPSLSGGQQQRIALARALALDPAVLLLDEPLSNLDAKLRDTMRFEIRRICSERHITAVYVTHDRKEALSMADQVAVLEKGNLSQSGSPVTIYNHPANRFCASFLGDINFLDAEFRNNEGNYAIFQTEAGIWRTLPGDCKTGEHYTLAFRPEAAKCDAVPDALNCFTGTIERSSFLGESSFRTISLDGCKDPLYINEYAAAERRDGDRLTFSVPAERISILESATC